MFIWYPFIYLVCACAIVCFGGSEDNSVLSILSVYLYEVLEIEPPGLHYKHLYPLKHLV